MIDFNIFYFIGKTKCLMKAGDCVIKHPGNFPIGLGMVVCICYFLLQGSTVLINAKSL